MLDIAYIKEGRDIGYVTVQRKTLAGLQDAIHDMTFSFAFNAFNPEGKFHK